MTDVIDNASAGPVATAEPAEDETRKYDGPFMMSDLTHLSSVPVDYYDAILDVLHFDIRKNFKALNERRRGFFMRDLRSGCRFAFYAHVTPPHTELKHAIPTPHYYIHSLDQDVSAIFAINRNHKPGACNFRHEPTPWWLNVANLGEKLGPRTEMTDVELQQAFVKWMMTNLGHAQPNVMNTFIQMAANSRQDVAAGRNWKTKEELQALMHPNMHPA